jgi:hypothetical protein
MTSRPIRTRRHNGPICKSRSRSTEWMPSSGPSSSRTFCAKGATTTSATSQRPAAGAHLQLRNDSQRQALRAPVNYALVGFPTGAAGLNRRRCFRPPPEKRDAAPAKRPIVIVIPRAGHGPASAAPSATRKSAWRSRTAPGVFHLFYRIPSPARRWRT